MPQTTAHSWQRCALHAAGSEGSKGESHASAFHDATTMSASKNEATAYSTRWKPSPKSSQPT
jgi:hypothetical protein